MHKIVLFGGTTEGRILTEFLSENKIPSIVCVATEYGEKVLEYDEPVIVRSGKLKPGPMQKLFQDEEVEMPSAFDNFSSLADRDYSDCTDTAAANAELLEQIMKKHGFSGYENEWWHFTDDTEYTVATYFDPSVFQRHCTDQCQ